MECGSQLTFPCALGYLSWVAPLVWSVGPTCVECGSQLTLPCALGYLSLVVSPVRSVGPS